MSGYTLTPKAEQELEEIWEYSAETWSEQQADRYVDGIFDAVELIAKDPRRGRLADDVRPGYRKYPAGSHLLFYRLVDGGIEVVRILHSRMDIAGQFGSED